MQLVEQTLLQFTLLVGVVFASTWVLMAVLMGTASRASTLFVAANLALVAGVGLTGLRSQEASYLFYHLADWVTLAGFACLHRGLLHVVDTDRPAVWHSVLPLFVAILVTLPFAPGPASSTMLGLALFGTAAWYTFTAFMDALRGLDPDVIARAVRVGASAPFFMMGVVLVLRTLEVLGGTLLGSAQTDAVAPSVFFLWAVVTFILLANIALATLSTGRLLMRIRSLAEMDYLTGCLNRRSLEQRMKLEMDRHARSGEPLACVFFDLDHFKRINDAYGHDAGDAALKHTVRLISSLLRSADVLGRYGGEEFVLLMPNTDLQGAADAANRMRLALIRSKLEVKAKVIPLTASFGAAVLGRGERQDDWVRRADAAMYEAKRLGRNRVEVDDGHTGPSHFAKA